jgi:hypothetical protein
MKCKLQPAWMTFISTVGNANQRKGQTPMTVLKERQDAYEDHF